MAVLAIDIGGTKLAVGIVDSEGRILARGEVPTLAKEGLEPVLGRIVGLGRDLLPRPEVSDVRVHRIGVGCAGPVDLKAGVIFDQIGDANRGRNRGPGRCHVYHFEVDTSRSIALWRSRSY